MYRSNILNDNRENRITVRKNKNNNVLENNVIDVIRNHVMKHEEGYKSVSAVINESKTIKEHLKLNYMHK
jgi:hypothetical protein